jgi:signal transduction histidine kinase/ActR/RegA family two-component response regulator
MKKFVFFIAIAACVLLLGLPIFSSGAQDQDQPLPPVAKGGVLDLDRWQLDRQGPIPLAGQWEFYWGMLLSPGDFHKGSQPVPTGWFTMPGVWNGVVVEDRKLDGQGFATFRLRLVVDPRHGKQALLIPLAFCAFNLWIDDQMAVSVGRVGESAAEMVPQYGTRVAFIDAGEAAEVFLTLQISNFMHAKGGMRNPIRLVAASQVTGLKHRALAKDVIVFGSLLIMSIYHLTLFALRRVDRFNLYFALCCLLLGIWTGMTGEVFLVDLFPNLNWQITIRLVWLCVYVCGPLGIAFISSFYPNESNPRIYRGSLIVGGVLALITLLAPSTVFTGMFPWLSPLICLMLAYITWVLVKALFRKRFGAAVMLASLLAVIITAVNDILYTNDLIHTGYYLPYGMLFFVFSQAMILANRSAKAYQNLETTNTAYALEIGERKRAEAKVTAYRDRLEELVRERTEALALANQRLREEFEEHKNTDAEKIKLQERLQQAQKMEALGTLAGGVAHDLNNILSGLVGFPDLLLHDLTPDSHLYKPMLTIQQSGQKAAAIVQDLLTLARRGVADFKVLNLNDIVSDYLESPEYNIMIQFHPRIIVKTNLAGDLNHLKGSQVHLFKTVMNLISNAAEAMPDGGTIHINTSNRRVDGPTGDGDALQCGEYAVLTVEDKGIGISKKDQERIFEPFYTNKTMGKSGTGLGMAVVWGTVEDHSGFIELHSREGEGTKFTLYFPATQECPAMEASQWLLADSLGSGQTILVVDDIAEQRNIATAMLTKLGYRAEAVSSGEAAVEYISSQTTDLLLLDMIMDPGIDGLETYRRILEINPQQKAVIASGYAENARIREALNLGCSSHLQKPYCVEDLAESVKAAIQKEKE